MSRPELRCAFLPSRTANFGVISSRFSSSTWWKSCERLWTA